MKDTARKLQEEVELLKSRSSRTSMIPAGKENLLQNINYKILYTNYHILYKCKCVFTDQLNCKK